MSRAWAVLGVALLACVGRTSAETLHVLADGSGDYPTIQAAVDAAVDGDVILLGDGVYRGSGNWDVEITDKDVTIGSESEDPSRVVVDCEDGGEPHRAFVIMGGHTAIRGISMVHGEAHSGSGGGGAMLLWGSVATITDCIFAGNTAVTGGAIGASWVELTIASCTFHGDAATYSGGGAALSLGDSGSAHMDHCIAAFGTAGAAVGSFGGSVELTCCDLFGNEGGDYAGPIESQLGQNGNIAEDPLFCDPPGLDLRIHSDSPCLPGGECGLMGAQPMGCGPAPVSERTWGGIKALYGRE